MDLGTAFGLVEELAWLGSWISSLGRAFVRASGLSKGCRSFIQLERFFPRGENFENGAGVVNCEVMVCLHPLQIDAEWEDSASKLNRGGDGEKTRGLVSGRNESW